MMCGPCAIRRSGKTDTVVAALYEELVLARTAEGLLSVAESPCGCAYQP